LCTRPEIDPAVGPPLELVLMVISLVLEHIPIRSHLYITIINTAEWSDAVIPLTICAARPYLAPPLMAMILLTPFPWTPLGSAG
jgi:hypothetical protein